MAPPQSTFQEPDLDKIPNGAPNSSKVPNEPGLSEAKARPKAVNFPKGPKFTDKHEEREYLKGRLALAFRIFGKYNFDEGIAGHITLRDPVEPHTFWVNPFGVPFALIKRSDLIQVDYKGNIIGGPEGSHLNTAAFMIHSAIHKARPDVLCAAHSHSLYGRAYAMLGRTLDIASQDACAFYKDQVLYNSFNGVVLAEDEGIAIAEALQDKKAAFLVNHGILTVGQTIEAAIFWYLSLEKCCHAQLMADAAAQSRGETTIKVTDDDAAFTYETVGTPAAGWFNGNSIMAQVHHETGGSYLN